MAKQKTAVVLDIEPAACICMAAAILFIPLRWMLCWLAAAVVHELCHYGMILLTGGRVHHIRVGFRGAVMETQFDSPLKEVACALAGPCGGFLLLLLARWFPCLALCGVVQSVCNLIPVYPLDGGRVVYGFLRLVFPAKADMIIKWICTVITFALLIFGIWGLWMLDLGVIPIAFAVILFFRGRKIKIPCKAEQMRVQ